MKTRRVLWTTPALCLLFASCERQSTHSQEDSSVDPLTVEKAVIAEERAALEAEREALQAELEAARTQQIADEAAAELAGREREIVERESELARREEDLAGRESLLNDRELAVAGREMLEDWEPDAPADLDVPVADYDLFYEDLTPHGSWFETPDYGYVFQPAVVVKDSGWRPYTRGRWACTNLGWTWVSDEPFGWACFHYGRWVFLLGRGWVWVPGDEWAPAWVCWREGGGHIGWAPLPPETMAFRGRGWGVSVEIDFGISSAHFTFVESRYMADPLWEHCLPLSRNSWFHPRTKNITNIQFHRNLVVCGGPRYNDIRKVVGKPWPVFQLDLNRVDLRRDLERRNAAFRGDRLSVFAPNMRTDWNAGLRPSRVAGKWQDAKPVRSEQGPKRDLIQHFREARDRESRVATAWLREREKNAPTSVEREKVLDANRRRSEAAQKELSAKRERWLADRRGARPVSDARPVPVPGRNATPDMEVRRQEALERQRAAEERLRQAAEKQKSQRPASPDGTRGGGTDRRAPGDRGGAVAPPAQRGEMAPAGPSSADRAESLRKRLEEARRETPAGRGNGVSPGRNSHPDPAKDQEENRVREQAQRQRQQAEAVRQQQEVAKRRQEEAKLKQDETRRLQQERAKRQQELRAREQAEAAKRRQEEAKRQQDEARQKQEEARRQQQDQMKRQQEERVREQAERQRERAEATRRQQEEAKRKQDEARQKQEEVRRQQEQMKREQEERAREQAERQREREESSRRQQEVARRQQEEAKRQQEERAREQAERQREQAEAARRQQEERSREQAERQREQAEAARRQQEERAREQAERQREQTERLREQAERLREQSRGRSR